MENISLLKKLPLFKDFKVTEVMNIAMVEEQVICPAGDLIFQKVGEISLADESPRSASVYADQHTELIKIKRADFRNLIAGNKGIERQFYKSFTRALCERLRVANENLAFSQEINKMIEEADNR